MSVVIQFITGMVELQMVLLCSGLLLNRKKRLSEKLVPYCSKADCQDGDLTASHFIVNLRFIVAHIKTPKSQFFGVTTHK